MNKASNIRDFRKSDVPLDGERLAADAALDAYIEAALRTFFDLKNAATALEVMDSAKK